MNRVEETKLDQSYGKAHEYEQEREWLLKSGSNGSEAKFSKLNNAVTHGLASSRLTGAMLSTPFRYMINQNPSVPSKY
ncbi:hypothetical protein QQP08_003134 [Theobroma cacao]|nr:hypothetical protein QQP08_003134 [Theobroma cacao]